VCQEFCSSARHCPDAPRGALPTAANAPDALIGVASAFRAGADSIAR